MFVRLVDENTCMPGCGVFVRQGEKELAVFHLAQPDRFVVSENACPHASGNLSAGEIIGHCVTCPVHQWKFDLETGYCAGTDDVILKRYECRVENGAVLADLSKHLPVPPPPRHEF